VIAVSSAEGLVFRLSIGGLDWRPRLAASIGGLDWRVALFPTVAGTIGVRLGDRSAGRVPAARLTRWFVWLRVALAA